MSKPPTPFPLFSNGGVLATGDLSGATIDGDDCISDGWTVGSDLTFFSQALGFWCNNPAVEQSPGTRSTTATVTVSGLPANTFVRIVSDVAFFSQDFGAAGKFMGMEINGLQFSPNVTASGTGTPNTGEVSGYGMTNSSGELDVVFAMRGFTVSYDAHIIFGNLRAQLVSAEFADIIVDSAVAWQRGNPTSVTRGSLAFEPNEVWENYDFPGKTMPVVGLDECVSMRPVVKGAMMMTGEDQFNLYRPGGSWTNGDSAGGVVAAGIRTFTPGAFRSALVEGAYLQNLIVIWKRQRRDYVAVEFLFALCTHFGISSQDGDEGLIPCEFEARQPNDGTPLISIPYLIHILPSTFAFAEGSDS